MIFLLLTQRLIDPLAQMSNIIDSYEDARASTKRILGIMNLPVRIQNADDATPLEAAEGHVAFDDVTFGYGDEIGLEDLDVDVDPGETVGLVGPTGAGKTTFVKLLLRLSTVRDADTILGVEDGRIVEAGTHDELLSADGLYANLWRVQAGEIGSLPAEYIEEASQRVTQQGLDSQ
ncbi:ABC transporter ATP-binding protein/permease [Halorhabdus salina]|uniref:ABC transporter ATP-binding protein/permease n=1 Tax=Halorhabdus salina TaxID=2750670 RepID=UPI002867C426|nr:ABC transporter ATP-binding protein/permease [Halorhabdus salina]